MAAVSLAEPEVAAIESLLERLRLSGIRIPRPAEVRDYVKRFPDILPVMRHACELTVAEFATNAALSLELYVDPEIDDRYLTLYVRQASYEPNLNDRLDGINEEFYDALDGDNGIFWVMTDYQPPQ